jgi:hypothetical protein
MDRTPLRSGQGPGTFSVTSVLALFVFSAHAALGFVCISLRSYSLA